MTLQEILVHFMHSFKNHVFERALPHRISIAGIRGQVKLISKMAKNKPCTLPFSKLEVNDQERESQNEAENTNSDVRNSKERVLTTYP